MSTIEAMSLDEINATMAQLRARKNALKTSNKVVQRKIATLARRREILIAKVNALDDQISQLRSGETSETAGESDQRRTRRTQAQVNATLEAIVACVKRHAVTKRSTIIEECQLPASHASIYLRQLCQEGKLKKDGEKSGTTYSLPA